MQRCLVTVRNAAKGNDNKASAKDVMRYLLENDPRLAELDVEILDSKRYRTTWGSEPAYGIYQISNKGACFMRFGSIGDPPSLALKGIVVTPIPMPDKVTVFYFNHQTDKFIRSVEP